MMVPQMRSTFTTAWIAERTINMESEHRIITATHLTVHSPGDSVFNERNVHLSIEDYAAGPFLTITSTVEGNDSTIHVEFSDWDRIDEAARRLMKNAERLG